MTRLLNMMVTDVRVQVRTNLYTIGIVVALITAVTLYFLATPDQLGWVVPTLLLLVVGGSTLLYVAAMIIFEKDEGTLIVNLLSPLRTWEYLWSKIVTLTALATLESLLMIGGSMLLMRFSGTVPLPNVPLLLFATLTIGAIYTLVGIVLVVPFDKLTDFLMPMAAVAVVLQFPFLYSLGWLTHWSLLLIPTSAPLVLMQGAFGGLAGWQWVYGLGYSAVILVTLTIWAQRAFQRHVVG